ncbi:hypothetical protein EVJ58_g6045 [Rhodofomes roseus]|uniref:Uncharacterized protein n=1 Tax=Rhodofomes roseus TaxID=34475 RepID=A0A4Y9Y9L9_9APHY|nr:hypothetical protein EVJ58_g6045 [Rhodofomes roseus]
MPYILLAPRPTMTTQPIIHFVKPFEGAVSREMPIGMVGLEIWMNCQRDAIAYIEDYGQADNSLHRTVTFYKEWIHILPNGVEFTWVHYDRRADLEMHASIQLNLVTTMVTWQLVVVTLWGRSEFQYEQYFSYGTSRGGYDWQLDNGSS